MANEKIDTPSFESQKPQEGDDCCENVPPSSLLGETCPATPSPNQNIKTKMRLSGLQSALTPILKYLNIGNKGSSLSIVSNDPTKPNASVSSLAARDNKDSNTCSVLNENLPEITLLDMTCNSTINMTNTQCDSGPSTPVFCKELKNPLKVLDVNLNSKLCPSMTPFHWLHDEILPEMTLMDDTFDTTINLTRHSSVLLNNVATTPFCKRGILKKSAEKSDTANNPNTAQTHEKSSVASEKEPSTLDTTLDGIPQKSPSRELSEIRSPKTTKLETSRETMSTTFNGNLTHSISSGSGVSESIVEDVKNVPLQVTQDISMSSTLESSKSSLENDAQTLSKAEPVTEAHRINVTHDLSTSNASIQCEASQSSGNLNNVTCELEGHPVKTSPEVKPNCSSGNISGINPSKAVSLNNTFTTVQDNATTQTSILKNQTMDLSSSNNRPPMTEKRNTSIISKQENPEPSLVLNGSCSDSKSSQSCEMQNLTFEKNSLQKSTVSTTVVQATATSISLHSTFENKPNETITFKETTKVGNESQDTENRSSPSPGKNETSQTNLSEMPGEKTHTSTASDDKPAELQEKTFNENRAAEEENFGTSCGEVKDSSNSGLPLCESIINHNAEGPKTNTFILDSTLDFKTDPLVTSTPMSTNKSFNFTAEREEGKYTAAQKRLYGEGLGASVAPVSTEIPSNIVCDRKTFLRQPAAKLNMPPGRPQSLLSKFKPASLLPKRPNLVTSGQPMNRQTEAPKTNAVQIFQKPAEMPNSYNLRSTASALKAPACGLRKAAPNSINSGIQRAGHGLKPPQANGTSSVPEKPAGGTNPLPKTILPAKRHPVPKTDAFPAPKKKKIDHPLQSNKVEASASSDTASKAKALKAPTQNQKSLPSKPLKHDSAVIPASSDSTEVCESHSRIRTLRLPNTNLKALTTRSQDHECANCTSLEAQLKLKEEEIRHLKEELLRYKK